MTAGQIIGFMGDTGNAHGVPHLHFELRLPDGTPINPYPAVVAAEQREQCTDSFGAWANVGTDPTILKPAVEVRGPDGPIWLITAAGQVVTSGPGAQVDPLGCGQRT